MEGLVSELLCSGRAEKEKDRGLRGDNKYGFGCHGNAFLLFLFQEQFLLQENLGCPKL